ncbi:MAG: hypothetical protein HQM03_22060 [Magnetococcales bacterium]|nr:hypothetical protein [Magnetococcales bacterium]MBF0182707.1 hypothetical protein [Magnetococcales bacterium]
MTTVRSIIEERIRTQIPGLRQVAGAAGLGTIGTGRVIPPAAFVVEAANTAGEAIEGSQQVTESIAVVVVVDNRRDPRGADASDTCRQWRDQVSAALLGWRPSPAHDPITYIRGSLVALTETTLSWQELYQTIGVRHAGQE